MLFLLWQFHLRQTISKQFLHYFGLIHFSTAKSSNLTSWSLGWYHRTGALLLVSFFLTGYFASWIVKLIINAALWRCLESQEPVFGRSGRKIWHTLGILTMYSTITTLCALSCCSGSIVVVLFGWKLQWMSSWCRMTPRKASEPTLVCSHPS